MKLKLVIAACAAVIVLPLAVVYGSLRASLPKLDGSLAPVGVALAVSIERDARGVPTIQAANRVDLAFGTGFVHAQDRFFQMDLSRRLAAGELSELFGSVALDQDRKARLFRFRHVAREALQQQPAEQRAVLEAYARGVNAGLAELGSRPWEYWILRSVPRPWLPEDTFLVSYAMWWDLQYSDLERAIDRKRINARLGGPECAAGWKCSLQFLYPGATNWDAPNAPVGVVNRDPAPPSDQHAVAAATANGDTGAIPPPEILNVRAATSGATQPQTSSTVEPTPLFGSSTGWVGIGSNNWAVAGRLTTTGAALIANDMHLHARVPTIWYRVRLRVAASGIQPALDMTGVSLPGAPLIVAGSNGHIAWGFTNSNGDWLQVQSVACTAVTRTELVTDTGIVPLTVQREEIRVHDEPTAFEVKSGPDGVLLSARPDKHACWFARWLAQLPTATNINLMALERTTSVADALAVAPTLGIPHQNLVVGDREGHIGWTIAGRIPASVAADRSDGTAGWTNEQTHPRIMDPEIGRLWTANARPTDDPVQQSVIGGSDASVGAIYDLGARTRQIRDDLLAIPGKATPADMLRIQLDDRAVFLTRWRDLLVELLDDGSVSGNQTRAEFRRLVTGWNGRASIDSVGYRLVRAFHNRTQEVVWAMLLRGLNVPADEQGEMPSQFEAATWLLVRQQPLHMLGADFPNWRDFLLAQVDATASELLRNCRELASCTWGSRQPVWVRHPLSPSLPGLAALLDMPRMQLAGDHDMPRVQDGPTGASERFAVSPGHEEEGYFHMPGGQSGHPLSPYYKAGFMDWANGTPTPFLPGPPQHKLVLQSQ